MPEPCIHLRSLLLTSLLIFTFLCRIYGQAYPGLEKNSIPTRFQAIEAEQGLPHMRTQALFQDHLGIIWIGTPTGLVKYDGLQFTTYQFQPKENTRDTSNSIGISVRAIAEDPDGDLWVGCDFENKNKPVLFCFDRKTETLIPYLFDEQKNQTLVEAGFRTLHISNGFVWMLSEKLFRISLQQKGTKAARNKLDTYKTFVADAWQTSFKTIYEDSKGQIWITGLRGVSKWIPSSETFHFFSLPNTPSFKINPYTTVAHMAEIGDGWFWVFMLGDNQILRYAPAQGKIETIEASLRISPMKVLQISNDQFWIGDRNGSGFLKVFNSKDRSIREIEVLVDGHVFKHPNRIISLFKDDNENIWVGTEFGALLKTTRALNQFKWLQFRPDALLSLSHNKVLGIDQDDNGVYWISTFGGGLNRWDRKRNQVSFLRTGKKDSEGPLINKLIGVEVTKDGKVWFGEGFSTGAFHPATNKFYHYQRPGVTFSILQDSQGRLWACKFGGGLSIFDRDLNDFVAIGFPDPENPSQEFYPPLSGIFEDSQGQLWLGCHNPTIAGFFRYNPETGQVQHFQLPEAHSFAEDHQGHIWIASFDGLYRYHLKTGDIKRFGLSEGLPNVSIQCVIMDDNQHLWVGTDDGLSKFEIPEETFWNFFTSDGLPFNKFAPFAYKNADGELFFGSDKGLLYFHPDSLHKNMIPPKVLLTRLDLNNQPLSIEEGGPLKQHISLTKEIHFSHHQNDLTIHYAGLHYKNPEKNQYQLKLEPYEKKWRSVGNQGFADYTNLDPGRYTFHVKAANSDGIWNDEPATLDIVISPPWYWNGWAWSIYLFLVFSFGYFLYRFQLNRKLALAEAKRLTDLDNLKTKLYTNITHEFRTPLTVIKGISDQISGHAKEKKLIQRNSDQLLDLINRLLELSKHEAGQLKLNYVQADILPFLRYVTESFHSYAIHQKINLNFYADADPIIVDFDREKILRLLSNLISNALKFTPEYGKVQVTAKRKLGQIVQKRTSEFIEIQVKDTGIGIAPEQIPHIFDRFYQADATHIRRAEGTGIGLALTKGLIDEMKGTISVNSKEGKGSIFTIQLPITNQAPREEALREEEVSLPVPQHLSAPMKEEALTAILPPEQGNDQPLLLLVEDNADVMHYLTSCLQGSFRLMYAKNGQSGIKQALQHVPDIIISDIMMPEVDGMELCKRLKTDERTSHIPIILLTAKADQGSRVEGLEKGADAYLAKPFDKKELMVRLNKLIELRKKLQNRYQSFGAIFIKRDQSFQQEDDFLEKVKQVIEENLDNEHFDIQQLYRSIGVSRIQLYRKLKALTDQSPAQIIQQIRLYHARELLSSSDITIGEIASRTGFKNQSYFTKKYKQAFGELPSKISKSKN